MNKEYLARELLNSSEENGLVPTLYTIFGKEVRACIPLTRAVCEASVDELDFSVRASNSLKRAGLFTVGEVADMIQSADLSHIRNLGKKTENEIKTRVLNCGYEHLTSREKLAFFLDLLNKNIIL